MKEINIIFDIMKKNTEVIENNNNNIKCYLDLSNSNITYIITSSINKLKNIISTYKDIIKYNITFDKNISNK